MISVGFGSFPGDDCEWRDGDGVADDERPSSWSQVSNARKVERERKWREAMRASEDSKFARAAEWMPRRTGGSTARAAAERRNGSTVQAGNRFCDHVGRAFFLPARARTGIRE